jgi:AcrR family transcriptional regulator
MTMMRLRPAETPAQDARDRILKAAERLFAEKGFAATAVHEITDAAEVNRALLYYYFEDKHSLYKAVIHRGLDQFRAMMDTALSADGPYAERLGALVRGHLNLLWNNGDLSRVVHRCLMDGHQQELGMVERFEQEIKRLEQFFRDGMAAGEFRVLDPALTARTVLAPTYMFAQCRNYSSERFDEEQITAHVTTLLLNGLR